MIKKIDVLIIGAGAAGLMCAIEAGKRGRRVLVLDHANKAGKKILMSGGGRCNFTNLNVSPKNFISHNPQFCRSALSRYTSADFIALVEKHAIPYHEKTLGQLFCDNKSKDILNMLLDECQQSQVFIKLNTTIKSIEKKSNGFYVATESENYACESLVIATGGLSIPTMGATAFGYQVAEQFGINVWPTRAALVPFTLHTKEKEVSDQLSGVSLQARTSCNKQYFEEGMLFTHRGLSGPAMLQISSYWNPGDELTVNLRPDINLITLLKEQHRIGINKTLKSLLIEHYPKRLVSLWLNEHEQQIMLQDISFKKLDEIAGRFQNWRIKPNGTEGYRTAEVTLGGVDCNAISSKTFEANEVSGLFFIGEVLDMTGWLGGYNFQWAWSSAYAAGSFV